MRLLANISTLFLITVASCTDIYFVEPQPKGVKPLENGFEELIGEYVGFDSNSDPDDTVIVTKDRIIFPNDEEMEDEFGEVIVVKKYKGNYFINFFDGDKDLWQLVVVKIDENESLEVTNLISINEDEANELSKKRFAHIEGAEDEDDYIVMNPSKKKLMKLIDYPIFDENKMNLDKIKID